MFKYIANCEVPSHGFDVIVTRKDSTKIYVEMKNKHNTMNSSSAQKTYIGMQNQILNHPHDMCFLVETIAKRSQNIVWRCSVNGLSVEHEKIRRVSMDKFYELVTGIPDAFFLQVFLLLLLYSVLLSFPAFASAFCHSTYTAVATLSYT